MGIERLYNSVEFDEPVELQPVGERCGRESHTRPKGLGALMSWGPEKMLIRCRKESHHPAEWPLGLRLSSPGEQERHNADGHKFWGQNIPVMFGLQQPLASKLWTTLSNLTNKVRGKYLLKKSSCVVYYCIWLIYCISMYPAWTCICIYKHIYYVSI